jgi:WD40 repeat protein
VISIALSESKQFIASGELAEQPEIHIWDINTYQNVTIIKGHHKDGVHLLSFFSSDSMLATCSIKKDSTVLIYNLKDSSLLLSTYVNGLAIDLFGVNNHIGINDYSL